MKWNNVFYCILLICANAHSFVTPHVHDGSLDPSFGQGAGFIIDSINGFFGMRAAVQSDGKIVSLCTNFSGFILVRLNSDGTLDNTFGTNGVVVETTGIFASFNVVNMLIQPDGKIVLAGNGTTGTNFQVTRYNPNGTLDESFGTGGFVIGPNGHGFAVALQADGKIVVAGSNESSSIFQVVRYNSNGAIDVIFEDGPKTVAQALTIQNDGKIVVLGINGISGASTLARYNADGTLDTSYIGTQTLSGSWNMIVLQPDGKTIVAAGEGLNPGTIARFTTDGVLDTTFGGGVVMDSFVFPNALLLQPDGKSLLVGTSKIGLDFALTRYTTSGELDPSFGNQGNVQAPAAEGGIGAALQANGKIIMVGEDTSGTLFEAARYINSSPLTPTQICGIKKGCNGVRLWGTAQNPSIVSIFRNGVFIGGVATDPKGSNTWTFTSPYKDGCYGVAARYPNGNVNTMFERMWLKPYINYGS